MQILLCHVFLTKPPLNKVNTVNMWISWNYPPPSITVPTRIIPWVVGNSYKPSFVTVTGWGVDRKNIPQQTNRLVSISKPGRRMGFHASNSMQLVDKKQLTRFFGWRERSQRKVYSLSHLGACNRSFNFIVPMQYVIPTRLQGLSSGWVSLGWACGQTSGLIWKPPPKWKNPSFFKPHFKMVAKCCQWPDTCSNHIFA